MKSSLRILLTLGFSIYHAQAAQYAFDDRCNSIAFNDSTTIDAKPPFINAMHEAVEIAENAFEVMSQDPQDAEVSEICKIVLGDSDTNYAAAKNTFNNLKAFSKDPSEYFVNNIQWRDNRQNVDVEFYCSTDRFIPHRFKPHETDPDLLGEPILWLDSTRDDSVVHPFQFEKSAQAHNTSYDNSKPPIFNKGYTTISDKTNAKQYLADKNKPDRKPWQSSEYSIPRPHLPCTIEVGRWWLDTQHKHKWPAVDKEHIEMAMNDDFLQKFLSASATGFQRTPIDSLLNLGVTLLHELTHTVQGGYLRDTPDKGRCYGWNCVKTVHNPENSDTIAWLGVALKLWTMGYKVDDRGYIQKRSQTK